MARDVVMIGATIAGLTAARRLAAEGFEVVVLDPNPPLSSAAIGHGMVATAHSSTAAAMAGAYGPEAVVEHVRRNLAGIEEIRRVAVAGAVELAEIDLHDHSIGAAVDRDITEVAALLRRAGAETRFLRDGERRHPSAALWSRALLADPQPYAEALLAQTRSAGAEVEFDVTVTHLTRHEGESIVSFRHNLAWARELPRLRAYAVVDTLGISPWGRAARVADAQVVPTLRMQGCEVPDVTTLLPAPPAWLVRPFGDEVVVFGPKCSPDSVATAADELRRWAESEFAPESVTEGRMVIDPSDHGRAVVGASAIPGGFYARGNGRGELMNGTASGCYLASLLLGSRSGPKVSLPPLARIRAATKGRLTRRLGD